MQEAKSGAEKVLDEKLFAIEAFVPENKTAFLEEMLQGKALTAELVVGEEMYPTYMENQGYSRVGEDLVHIYDTPSVEDPDPSLWVFWFFAVFYAMIVADAGYGFLYFLFALFLQRKFPEWTGVKKRCRTLLMTISIFAMGWGVLTASYFGITIGPDNPLTKISLVDQLAQKKATYHLAAKDATYQEWLRLYPAIADARSSNEFFTIATTKHEGKVQYKALNDFYDSILMEIALIVGLIHLLCSFGKSARKNPSGVGWALAMIGGYLYFPKFLAAITILNFTGIIPPHIAYFLGSNLLWIGLSFAILASVWQNKLVGLFEIANVIQVFADVLSYLRLYALGLAGMIMADTFNQIALSVGLLPFGWIILFVGHTTNISLGIMGGVIHGLRLNFLEWYHYCFEGGGRPFNPLKLLNKLGE